MAVNVGSSYPSPSPFFFPGDNRRGGRRSSLETGEVTIVEPLGDRSYENDEKWRDVQIPYENLAHNRQIREQALHFVQGHAERFQNCFENIRPKWLTIEHVLKGNTITRWSGIGAVHIPELYKMLETSIPRLEEAIFSFDPWFHVVGREEGDQEIEDKIRWFLEFQLDQARFDDLVQPFLRSIYTYGFAALKIRWRRKWEWVIERKGSRVSQPDGTQRWTFTKEEKKKITYEGPEFVLVDPFDFGIDHQVTNYHDASVIWDDQWMTLSTIEALAEENDWNKEGLQTLREQTPMRGRGTSDYYQQSRSLVGPESRWVNEPRGSDQKYKVRELWGKFDLFNEGLARECVITVANESVVLRVQENPFDTKFRPYAIGRAVREPFQFYGVGPLDNAVRLGMELDDHRNLALESHRLAVNPIVFVDANADIPQSLYGVTPGSVFRTNSPRDIQFTKIPMSVRDAQSITEELRRDIEETTGAPRIWEGAAAATGSGTATEVERKVQEGNRRLKGILRSVTFAFSDMLSMMHEMNAQFMTRDQRFRVLGKKAKGVQVYDEISPETFQHAVDFEFQGIMGLENLGLRATQLIQYVQTIAPLVPFMQGAINFRALGIDLYRALVNERPADEIIEEVPSLDRLMDPEEENLLLSQGQKVATHPMDDDDEHIAKHEQYFNTARFHDLPEAAQAMARLHLAEHYQQKAQKDARRRAQAQMAPAFPNSPVQNGMGGRPPMQSTPPEYGGTGAGAPGSTPGVTPGVPQGQGMPQTPGRNGQIYQNQQETQR